MLLIIAVASIVRAAVDPSHERFSLEKAVMKLPFVPSAIWPCEHTEAMPLGIFIEGTFVRSLLANQGRSPTYRCACGFT